MDPRKAALRSVTFSALLVPACAASPRAARPAEIQSPDAPRPEITLATAAREARTDSAAWRSPIARNDARPASSAVARAPEPAAPRPRSSELPSGLWNPMPGGVMAGYQADTGLDIAGTPRPVYAIAAGTLDYSEPGHTLWTGPSDTANCVRFELDEPIPYRGHRITHVYYAHLKALASIQHEGEAPRRHVEAGEMLGVSGVARHTPHLHIGLLLDGEVEQYRGTFLLADAIRALLGPYKNGDRLPAGAGAGAGMSSPRRMRIP